MRLYIVPQVSFNLFQDSRCLADRRLHRTNNPIYFPRCRRHTICHIYVCCIHLCMLCAGFLVTIPSFTNRSIHQMNYDEDVFMVPNFNGSDKSSRLIISSMHNPASPTLSYWQSFWLHWGILREIRFFGARVIWTTWVYRLQIVWEFCNVIRWWNMIFSGISLVNSGELIIHIDCIAIYTKL